MPDTESSQAIGANTERLLKEFLSGLLFNADPARGFPDDLRLMSAGSQQGLDLKWELRFRQGGIQYTWYFESKSHGKTKYLESTPGNHEPFHINLISDKLLQVLSYKAVDYTRRKVDCWCLFAPYIKLDAADQAELEKIQDYLPFKLVVWDKDFLLPKVKHVSQTLHDDIYPKDPDASAQSEEIVRSLVNLIREQSISGRFWSLVDERFRKVRNDIIDDCKKELILQSIIPSPQQNTRTTTPQRETQYYFEYGEDKYFIEEQFLTDAIPLPDEQIVIPQSNSVYGNEGGTPEPSPSAAPTEEDNLEAIRAIYVNAICTDTGKSLHDEFKSLLIDSNVPFLQVTIKHKIPNFVDKIHFELIHDGTYFESSDKPVNFVSVKDYA